MKFTDSHNVVLVANVMTLKTQAMAMMAAVALCAASAQAAVSVLGDANLDERVDAVDASAILREYASLSTSQGTTFTDPQQKINADVNKDKKVDAKDASLVLSFYAFLSTGGSGSMEDWLATQAG